jgi:hypothetical protein
MRVTTHPFPIQEVFDRLVVEMKEKKGIVLQAADRE